MRVWEFILLMSVPGLMFCIIPVTGMEFSFSWQLASLWLGGAAFAALLSNWWRRVFFLLALVRTATIMPPRAEAYIALLTIAVFLAAAEGFSRMDRPRRERAMDAMCAAAALLLIWMLGQKCGLVPAYFAPQFAGPFNPDAAGVFLALALPACLATRKMPRRHPWLCPRDKRSWLWLCPLVTIGIVVTGTTTGILAATAAILVFAYKTVSRKMSALILVAAILGLGGWFWQIDPLSNMKNNNRWVAWKHAAWSIRSEMWGRGLGSWQETFPLLASGDKRLGDVEIANGKLTTINVFAQAHNEYVQAAYELGLQTLLMIAGFLAVTAWSIIARPVPAHVAAGMSALAVACFGWHVFHIAPLALLGCAWLGMWGTEATGGAI